MENIPVKKSWADILEEAKSSKLFCCVYIRDNVKPFRGYIIDITRFGFSLKDCYDINKIYNISVNSMKCFSTSPDMIITKTCHVVENPIEAIKKNED